MTSTQPKNTDEWIELISQQELPSLGSTVHKFKELSQDEATSMALIGQSILHDHALTSKILKIANSTRSGRNKVTTISRASVILGIENIKSICITANLLTDLLKKKQLSTNVYHRLLKLTALSFQSAIFAKMLADEYDDNSQEEMFIAALLKRIGETAFWSLGGPVANKVDKLLDEQADVDDIVGRELGTTFNNISLGLAKKWHYGSFLLDSYKTSEFSSDKIKMVALADQLSFAIHSPASSDESVTELIEQCSRLTNKTPAALKAKLTECAELTVKQLSNYGAHKLTQFIKTDLQSSSFHKPGSELEPDIDKNEIQLEVLRDIALMALKKPNLNQLLHTAMEGIARGVGFERTVILLTDNEKKVFTPRLVFAKHIEELKHKLIINKEIGEDIFKTLVHQVQPLNLSNSPELVEKLPPSYRSLLCKKGFCLAPIVIAERCIGLIYGDFDDSELPVSDEEFDRFCHITLQANLVLSVISQK